jgi:hypothetical protein
MQMDRKIAMTQNQDKYISLDDQYKIREHITEYKVKSKVDWILLKTYLNIWRGI